MDITVYKKTSDDWWPSFVVDGTTLVCVEINKVESPHDTIKSWLVSVHGRGDYYTHRTFKNEEDAVCCFLDIVTLEDVTRNALIKMGFVT